MILTLDDLPLHGCFISILPELRALPPRVVVPIDLDVPKAVETALGVIERIGDHPLPGLGHADLQRLEQCALALTFAMTLRSPPPREDPVALCHEATALRDVLRAELDALIRRDLLSPDVLGLPSGKRDSQHVAADVRLLVAVLMATWPRIEGPRRACRSDLDHGLRLAACIFRTLARRRVTRASADRVGNLRDRAFTLFIRAYQDVRRTVGLIRQRQGDADVIAPPLYAERSNARRSAVAPRKPPPTPPVTPSPLAAR